MAKNTFKWYVYYSTGEKEWLKSPFNWIDMILTDDNEWLKSLLIGMIHTS
jgi:hypothetical protein